MKNSTTLDNLKNQYPKLHSKIQEYFDNQELTEELVSSYDYKVLFDFVTNNTEVLSKKEEGEIAEILKPFDFLIHINHNKYRKQCAQFINAHGSFWISSDSDTRNQLLGDLMNIFTELDHDDDYDPVLLNIINDGVFKPVRFDISDAINKIATFYCPSLNFDKKTFDSFFSRGIKYSSLKPPFDQNVERDNSKFYSRYHSLCSLEKLFNTGVSPEVLYPVFDQLSEKSIGLFKYALENFPPIAENPSTYFEQIIKNSNQIIECFEQNPDLNELDKLAVLIGYFPEIKKSADSEISFESAFKSASNASLVGELISSSGYLNENTDIPLVKIACGKFLSR